jgi:hypothetical protein
VDSSGFVAYAPASRATMATLRTKVIKGFCPNRRSHPIYRINEHHSWSNTCLFQSTNGSRSTLLVVARQECNPVKVVLIGRFRFDSNTMCTGVSHSFNPVALGLSPRVDHLFW